MKQRRIILLLAVVLLAALALWLLSSPTPSTRVTSIPEEKATQEEQPQPTDQSGLPQPIFKERPSEEVLQQKIEEGRRGQIAQMLEYAAAFNTPINFWGKVVDEKGQPVSGALVKMGASDQPLKTGTQYEKVTDANGLFSITGAKGLSLSVNVSKEGYYQTDRSRGHASYYHPSENKEPLPTPDKPAIFELLKMGEAEPLIPISSRTYRVPRDGTPVEINLANGRVVPAGNGDLRVEAWTDDQNLNEKRRYNWRCRITAPGGSLVERKGQFDFEAPEDGYEESVELGMPGDAEQWSPQQQRDYFAKLSDGRYARFKITMIAKGDHFFRLESFLNPTPGSRNLEYDKAKQVNP